MPARGDKTETLNLRVTPEIKAGLAAMAEGDKRSMTAQIEWLYEQELKRRKAKR